MKLLEPIQVGNMTLKNRTYNLPFGNPGQLGDTAINFWVARAKGGMGAMCVGNNASWDRLLDRMEEMRPFVDAVHDAAPDCMVGIQASIGDGVGHDVNMRPLTPSGQWSQATRLSIGDNYLNQDTVEITKGEIKQFSEMMAESAYRQKQVGFDFLELHATHGYLFRQFLSPMDNHREDEYGGSLENRMRFAVETVQAIRATVGDDFGLTMRLAAMEPELDGITLDDGCRAAIELERAGVDALIISEGVNAHPRGFISSCVPFYVSFPRNCYANWAAAIKKVVNIPVVATGRILRPEEAEAILQEDQADIIGLGRAVIADPEWVNKTAAGAWGNIAPCLGCNFCFDYTGGANHMTCAVNARVCAEAETEYAPAAKKKKVMVIGGGPAGMEAARISADRGHDVTLWDKGDQLGGLLFAASVGQGKEQVEEFRKYLVNELERTGVKVKLKATADAALVAAEKPDAVVVAAGSKPRTLDIPGIDRDNVVLAEDVLEGTATVGQQVLVVGGGMVGLEAAEVLAHQGKTVRLVEILDELATDLPVLNRPAIVHTARMAGMVSYTNAYPEEITEDGVKVVIDRHSEFFEVDTVVLAVGREADDSLTKSLEGAAPELHVIGDASGNSRFREAIGEGYRVGVSL